jgi:predicted amidohydrolase YtcJ
MAERVRHVGFMHPGRRLQWGGVKEFSDGSLGSHTALMHEPYAGRVGAGGTQWLDEHCFAGCTKLASNFMPYGSFLRVASSAGCYFLDFASVVMC